MIDEDYIFIVAVVLVFAIIFLIDVKENNKKNLVSFTDKYNLFSVENDILYLNIPEDMRGYRIRPSKRMLEGNK